MSSSSRRSYYDPKQPRLLSEEEIGALAPAECDVACLQIDQILVSILQNIDADFGRSHRIITDKILPDLERYGEASKGIWEGLKFWQGFFEASVNVKLSGNNEESVAGPSVNDSSHQLDDTSTETIQQDVHQRTIDPGHSNSPFDALKTELHQNLGILPKAGGLSIDVPPAHVSNDSHQTGSSASLQRPPHWHDLSMDSPDTTLQMPIPKDVSLLIDSQSGNSLDSDISMSSFMPDNEQAQGGSKAETSPSHIRQHATQGKVLLHQALLRNTMIGKHKRQTISTPAKPQSRRGSIPHRGSFAGALPPEMIDPNWNGLTDLRKVPLDGLMGLKMPHRKFGEDNMGQGEADEGAGEERDESLRAGISPPQTIHFSVPRSKLAQTPSKEAARLVTRDVLETARLRAGYANPIDLEDSPPLEPPSVLREWKQRGYESLYKSRADEDSQQNDSHSISSIGHVVKPDQVQPGSSRDVSVSRALIDLREEDTSSGKISKNLRRQPSNRDDPFNGSTTARSRESQRSPLSGPSTRPLGSIHSNRFDDSMDDIPGSPTLFGVRHQSKQSLDSSTNPNPNPEKPSFVPMMPEEMDTFFGGNLLESECFEPSPLQGKRIRYTDPKDR